MEQKGISENFVSKQFTRWYVSFILKLGTLNAGACSLETGAGLKVSARSLPFDMPLWSILPSLENSRAIPSS